MANLVGIYDGLLMTFCFFAVIYSIYTLCMESLSPCFSSSEMHRYPKEFNKFTPYRCTVREHRDGEHPLVKEMLLSTPIGEEFVNYSETFPMSVLFSFPHNLCVEWMDKNGDGKCDLRDLEFSHFYDLALEHLKNFDSRDLVFLMDITLRMCSEDYTPGLSDDRFVTFTWNGQNTVNCSILGRIVESQSWGEEFVLTYSWGDSSHWNAQKN